MMKNNTKKKSVSSVSSVVKPAFTLVEVLIVVAILGILAAIVLPEVNGYTQKAKESAAKDNLRILRETIERYAADHNGVPPGYPNGFSSTPTSGNFPLQLTYYTKANGEILFGGNKTDYPYGPYLPEIPDNPINNAHYVYVFKDGDFPELPIINTNTPIGWVFKASTKEMRLNLAGTDSEGISYSDY